MTRKRFYHRYFLVLSLLGISTLSIAANQAESLSELEQTSISLPPRSINDITRMLSDHKQHDDLVNKLITMADALAPDTTERKPLFDFYWKRGLAAGELGRVQQQISDLQIAISNGQSATPEYARALRNLAFAEVQGGNFLSALRNVNDSIRHIPTTSRGQLTGAYAQLVALSALVGDFEGAQRNLNELESTLVMLKSGRAWGTWSHFWLANYERARGEFFRLSGKAVEAEGAYRKSLREIQLSLVDLPALSASGQDAPTLENMQMLGEGVERGLSMALLAQGKLVESEAMVRTSLEHTLKRVGRNSPDVARGLGAMANVIAEQGRYLESAKLSEAALNIMLRSGAAPESLPVMGAYRANLAAQVALGNYPKALDIYAKMQGILADKPELAAKILRGDLDVVLALLRTQQTNPAEKMSSAMLEKARQQFGEDSVRTAEIRGFHAIALADNEQNEQALSDFRKAIPVLSERVRNDSEAETASSRRQQRFVIILERYIQLLGKLQDKGTLPSTLNAANESFMLADLARGSSVQRALSRSAARAAIKDPGLASLARQEQDAQRRANSLNDLLSQLLSAAPEQQLPAIQAKIRNDIVALKQSRDQLKKEIEQRFPDYAQLVNPRPVNMLQVQKMLQPGEVMLAWYFGEQNAHLWAIVADGRTRFATLKTNRKEMAAEVEKLRKALNPEVPTIEQIPPFDVVTAHQLYQQLIGPAAELLEGANTLLAVPHGELGQLPLSLLVSRPVVQPIAGGLTFSTYRNVPWLMRKIAIAQLPSVSALASLRQLPAAAAERLPFIGFGDPYFSEEQATQADKKGLVAQVAMRGVPLRLRSVPKTQSVDSAELALLPRLPDTAQEIREIAAALGAEPSRDVFLQRAASEKTVFATDLSNRRVVMFATHGLIPGELNGLTQPALALSAPTVAGGEGDGLLTQEEILSLKLNADWVVLSACNTAAGEGAGSEAISGLGRAFFYAGARALLVSNWPVETEAARGLMTDLFKRQATNASLGKAEALRLAMQGLIDGPGRVDAKTGKSVFSYAHPLFWAPFVLVGD